MPLGGLPLLSPLLAATALPELALNLSRRHANADVDPLPLHGRRDPRARGGSGARGRPRSAPSASLAPALGRGLVVLVLVAGSSLGPLPLWSHAPLGSKLATRDHVVTSHSLAAARVLQALPPAVAVSATNTLGAHLSARRRIFSFPVLREARWVAVDLTRPSYLDDARGRRFAAAYAALRQDARWQVVRPEDGVVVLRRD